MLVRASRRAAEWIGETFRDGVGISNPRNYSNAFKPCGVYGTHRKGTYGSVFDMSTLVLAPSSKTFLTPPTISRIVILTRDAYCRPRLILVRVSSSSWLHVISRDAQVVFGEVQPVDWVYNLDGWLHRTPLQVVNVSVNESTSYRCLLTDGWFWCKLPG